MCAERRIKKRRLFLKSIVCTALLATVCPASLPLDHSRKISQYGHSVWRIQDGYLPGPPEDIAQTKDGYIWIATDLGLIRFDGVRFVPWASLTTEQLPDSHIVSLLGGSDGSLWIGTLKGLARWKDGQITSYEELPNRINGITEDRQGRIWIARSEIKAEDHRGVLCRVTGTAVRCFGRDEGVFLSIGTGMTIDPAGNIWIFGDEGLCKWNNGVATPYFRKELSGHGYLIGVSALAVQNEEHFWVGLQQANGNLELREFDEGRWRVHRLPKVRQGPDPSTNALFLDAQGALWIGTASDGMYRISADKVDHFANVDGLSSDSVGGFFEDREGVLWVSSTKGIDSFRDLPVVSFSIKEGLASDSVSSILGSRDGGIWIGGAEALGFLKGNKLSAIRTNHGLPGRDITTMFEDNLGQLWLGVDTNLSVLNEGRFLPIQKPGGAPLGIIFGVAEDTRHNEWVVTESALFRVEGQKVRSGIPLPQKAFAVASDPKDGIWLGFETGDLAHYSVGHSEEFPADQTVSTARIRLLLPDSGGLWAVTANGLVWWNGRKRTALTTRNGLPCNELYSAVKDTDGALWVYSRCGLFGIAASQLSLFRGNPDARVKTELLDIYDGVQPGSTPLQPQATRSTDGRLWFANNNIVQTFDPREWHKNTLVPSVVAERVMANGINYFPHRNLELPALIGNLEIDFAALSFVVPQKVRFLYKLDGHDKEWQDSEGRRQAFYNDLRPGNYRFRVTACNNDGVWNEEGASFSFTIAPAWYQTAAFRVSCLIASLCVLWLVYYLRMKQASRSIRARFEERIDERTRLARELHDTLLQTLQGSKLVADDALEHRSDPEYTRRSLEKLSDWIDRAIREGRAALNALHASAFDNRELSKRLQSALDEQVLSGVLEKFVTISGTPVEMDPIITDEICRVGYEAIRNAFMHSHASCIEVQLAYSEDFTLIVRDNGRGMDSTTASKGKDGHFGLQSMRARAARIHGQFQLITAPNLGTTIELKIKGKRAFHRETSVWSKLLSWLREMRRSEV
jgi:signal transduction histidine kinase/ligand-binding sensor domain-containing protein